MHSKLTLILAAVFGCLLITAGLVYTLTDAGPLRAGAGSSAAVPRLVLPPAGEPAPDVEWDRVADLGKGLPSSLLVYRLLRAPTGEERVRELAAIFTVSGEPKCSPFLDGEMCGARGGGRSVDVDRDGRFGFTSDAALPLYPDGVPPCTDEEAAAFVTDFLEKSGLLPADSGFTLSGVTYGGRISRSRADGTWYDLEYGKLVGFNRTVGGLPVYGVSRIVVGVDRIDGDLQVVDLTSAWHPIEPYAELPLRSIDDAYADIVLGKGMVDMPLGGRAVVEQVSLAYYEPPLICEQPYLQPVYHFTGTVGIAGQSATFSAIVPAISGSAIAKPIVTATPVVGEPVIPTGPIESARALRDGKWVELGDEEVQAILAAAIQRLRGRPSANSVYEAEGASGMEPKLAALLAQPVGIEGAAELTYAAPVEFAAAVEPGMESRHYLPQDSASRTVVVAQRLVVIVLANHELSFTFLPKPSGEGQAYSFFLPPDDRANPGESMLQLEQLILGGPATTE